MENLDPRCAGSMLLFALPTGHYQSLSGNDHVQYLFDKELSSFYSYHSTIEKWKMFEMGSGFYYYQGRTFHIPRGYLIAEEAPGFMIAMGFLYNHLAEETFLKFVDLDPKIIKKMQLYYGPLYEVYHVDPTTLYVTKFHSNRLDMKISKFMKCFLLN